MKLRLLPVAILALALSLGVKLGGAWIGMIGGGVSPSLAQQAPAQPAKPGTEKSTAPAPAKQGAGTAATGATEAGPSKAPEKDGKSTRPGKIASGLPDDPALFTQAEIELLQKLSTRRGELEKWSQELEMREGLLRAAEQRIDRKVVEMRQIQAKVQKMLRQYDKEQENKLKSLVKIYETMKPKEAAGIFMQLEMPVLLDVVERMKEAKAAAIIAKMEPKKAKDVTSKLAKRRKIGVDVKAKLPAGADGTLPSSGPVPGQG